MINTSDKSLCCGCGLCETVCPKNAITMIEDEKGFVYPNINENKCINCNICSNYCEFQKEYNKEYNIKEIYALQHNDINILKHSSSGGAFTAFSDIILNEDGYVYGASYDKEFNVYHTCAKNSIERDIFRTSKYVQSSIVGIYNKVKADLVLGKKILFTGTPCQCASLLSFFKEKPENLYVIDILCHGVPSNKILKDFILLLEKKYKKKIINFNYRSKKYGYNEYCEILLADNKIDTNVKLTQIYKFFTISMRDACHNCPYASKHRCSDITIGDYCDYPENNTLNKSNGVSIVFINTEKGKDLFNKLNNVNIKKINEYKSLNKRQPLNHPTKKHNKTDEFWTYYVNNGFEKTIDRFCKWTIKSSIYHYLLRLKYILSKVKQK